jgi:hypothetical protein
MLKSIWNVLFATATLFVTIVACNQNKGSAGDARTNSADTNTATTGSANVMSRQLAKEGDTVWVLINHVKGDKKEQFERFVHEVFWDGSARLSQEDQRVFKQTRVLHPIQQEKDGSYNYIFIMDPVLKGGNYDIRQLLDKIYKPEKAAEYEKLYNDAVIGDQTAYVMVQSRH